MTIALIISPYNAPTPEARAANVRLGIALARWAAAQGYTPVGWWCDVDPANPESDADPVVRAAALARSAERARMVGAAGGVAVVPDWIESTSGMDADGIAFGAIHPHRLRGGGTPFVMVSLADLAPYLLPEPVPTVPRAAVQAAVDEMKKLVILHEKFKDVEYFEGNTDGMNDSLSAVCNHTGVTPSEVQ